MRRKFLLLHLTLASFFLPVALMFGVTGGLYTLAIKGGYGETVVPVALTEALRPDLDGLMALTTTLLRDRNEARPTGEASLKKAGTSFELEWTGVNRDVLLRPTADPLGAELVLKDTSPYRRLVQLHKAKGSPVAKALSVAWALGLVLILLSGVWMALTAPPFRRLALGTGAAGLLSFLIYVTVG